MLDSLPISCKVLEKSFEKPNFKHGQPYPTSTTSSCAWAFWRRFPSIFIPFLTLKYFKHEKFLFGSTPLCLMNMFSKESSVNFIDSIEVRREMEKLFRTLHSFSEISPALKSINWDLNVSSTSTANTFVSIEIPWKWLGNSNLFKHRLVRSLTHFGEVFARMKSFQDEFASNLTKED